MRATGFSTYGYKLAAFVISGALAGLAGALFALKDGVVNPELSGQPSLQLPGIGASQGRRLPTTEELTIGVGSLAKLL